MTPSAGTIPGTSNSRNDRGATAVLFALTLVALFASLALVIDLGASRNERASSRTVTDSAASAGAIALGDAFNDGDFSGRQGCEAARDYLIANVAEITSLAGIGCASWTTDCVGTPAARELSEVIGDLKVTIVHPVTNTHRLLDPSAVGAGTQAATADDGDPCSRIGVEITATRDTTFAPAIGVDSSTTTVHTVALATTPEEVSDPIALLLLERHDCQVLAANGNGAIAVGQVTDSTTGLDFDGRIAVDSDGTGSNCGGTGTVDTDGGSASIRADGAPGCVGELPPSGSGLGCGLIELFAPGTPGCNQPACEAGSNVSPSPTALPEIITRAPIDHRYNCKLTYPVSFDIAGCRPRPTNGPYLDQLVGGVGMAGTPPGFQSYDALFPCNVNGSPIVVPAGNWHVGCPLLRVRDQLTFTGGNVVIDGNVRVEDTLRFNSSNPATMSWSPGDPVSITASSPNAAFVFLRGGTLLIDSGSTFDLDHTFLYVAPPASLDTKSGSDDVAFVSPTVGPFEDLAVWSDSTTDMKFNGSASLSLEGTFFSPYATMTLRGSGTQQQVGAQLVVRLLDAGGNGTVVLEPDPSRSTRLVLGSRSTLIR